MFTLFLGRMFGGAGDAPWVLLGGNALLIRTGGGRFTKDIDLARNTPWDDLDDVRVELQELANQRRDDDPFRFEIYAIEAHSEADAFGYGTKTAKAKVRALLGTSVFETFTIDITARRYIDGPIDTVPLRANIAHETLRDLPSVPTTPAENHLADKICAMYELHGPDNSTPSTRYRDLADIVRLVSAVELDAELLHRVLRNEERRRRMALPTTLTAPAPEWASAFPVAARDFSEYPTELHSLEASLAVAAACLADVLTTERQSGTWNPNTRTWEHRAPTTA